MSILMNEEIARVYAMYVPTKIINGIDGDHTERQLSYSNIYTYAYTRVGKPKILLLPLSGIRDEHAIQIADILNLRQDFGKSPLQNEFDRKKWARGLMTMVKEYDHFMGESLRLVNAFQYLIQEGYAVPLFFGVNHWANGKTAIELGLAIDKTTLNQSK